MRLLYLLAVASCVPQTPSGSYHGDYWFVATGGATGAGSIEVSVSDGLLDVTDGCTLAIDRLGEQEIDNVHKSHDDYEFYELVEPGQTCAIADLSFSVENGNLDVIDGETLMLEAGGSLDSGGYVAFNFSGVGADD